MRDFAQTQPEDFMDDSERMPLEHDRRAGGNRRKLVRYLPDISAGSISNTITLLVMAGTVYGTYTADRSQIRAEMAAQKQEAELNRQAVVQSLTEVKADLRELKTSVQTTREDIASVKAQIGMQPPMRTTR